LFTSLYCLELAILGEQSSDASQADDRAGHENETVRTKAKIDEYACQWRPVQSVVSPSTDRHTLNRR
jgi:hypothetical protein